MGRISRIATTEATETPTVTDFSAPLTGQQGLQEPEGVAGDVDHEQGSGAGGEGDEHGVQPDGRSDRREESGRGDGGDRDGADGDVKHGGDGPDQQERGNGARGEVFAQDVAEAAAATVAARDPPTPVKIRICPLSLNPMAMACSNRFWPIA